MKKRLNTKAARKPPQQSRSRVTVTAILDAMTRVLDREGAEAATTTRIAEVAGISIGTLYQYFSHRDAILDALQDREFERAMELLRKILLVGPHASAREVAHEVFEGMLGLYASAPGLHRLLVVEGLRVTPTDRVLAFDRHVVDVIRTFLAVAKLPIRRTNMDAAAFVVFQAVRASMLARLLEAPVNIDDATLIEELTDLVLRYLVDEPATTEAKQAEPHKTPSSHGKRPRERRTTTSG
jgi:AcrR family transcriptional regulator